MSFLDDGYLGAEPGLGKNVFEKVGGAVTGAISKASQDAFKAVAKAENQAAVAALEAVNRARAEAANARILAAAATKKATAPVADAAAQAFSAAYEAAQKSGQAVGTAAKQASGAVGTAVKQTGIAVTDALKTAAKATVGLISKKGGRVVNADGGPIALPELNLLGWSVFADPAVPGEPTLNPGTDAEAANPAWPGYFATKGGERIGPTTWDRLESEILKRPAPALDATGTQATWEGWAFWMIPATPGDTTSEGWPGYFAEKAGTRTSMGTADAVMKDVQAREAKNALDQELPQGETNPYLGWALWWRPSEGDAGIYGKKNGVETIHGTADAVAIDIQNREKANQPQTPSGGVEAYSGQDYNGWQIWRSQPVYTGPGVAGAPASVFGVQGASRTQLYQVGLENLLYADIDRRNAAQQPGPLQPDPYQPSPYQPSPYLPSPYQPSPYQPAPMTGGGGSFLPSSGGFMPSSSGYQEGGFLAPGGLVDRPIDEAISEPRRETDEAAEPEFEEVEVEEVEYEDAEYEDAEDLDSGAVDGLGASPSLPSAILPLAGVALLWYLVTRK
jgi:hypothetical protein